ncbi:hypothetical protein [Pedobacter chitinilyticus]|uniref:Uncharacterized protein n=1 Tax=Pedobacter chitinilyticus TaxID=2233776 RepID=A0A443YL17_9SPHI|nr:hypothetical protein [Pedobacter chitinilyticus]RWU04454.1 hypothetical protein DPV69_19265 [Pedobacter chitinilyticus]
MNPILRNILAVIAGLVIGSIVNMGIIMISHSIIPLPAGADNTTVEGLKATMHLFEPKHFIFPFLAHAIGTFVGAYVCARIAVHKMVLAMFIGLFFLAGGIYMVMMVPSPIWFTLVDLLGAYLPVAYFAGKIASSSKNENS